MNIPTIQNSQNYHQNFGINVSTKALSVLADESFFKIKSRKNFLKIKHFIKAIKKTESDRIVMSKVSKNKQGKFTSVLTYFIDGRKYSTKGNLPVLPTGKFNSRTDMNKLDEFRSALRDISKKLLSVVMDGLSEEGRLMKNAETIKADFPHNYERFKQKLDELELFDDFCREICESERIANMQKNEYRQQHPILAKIASIFGC